MVLKRYKPVKVNQYFVWIFYIIPPKKYLTLIVLFTLILISFENVFGGHAHMSYFGPLVPLFMDCPMYIS